MGLFSSKTKISVSSVTINLGGDPDEGQYNHLIYAILKGTSLSKSLLENIVTGMGLKMKSVYTYARDHYTLGLPQGSNGGEGGDVFYPVIPLRYNNADLTDAAHKTTPLYLTSKKLLKKLNIDIDVMAENINKNEEGISGVDHAYIMFGVELQTKNNESIRYLTEYFHHIAENSQYNIYDFITYASTRSLGSQNIMAFAGLLGYGEANVHLNEHGLDVQIRYTFVNTRIKAGVIGPVGTATSVTDTSNVLLYKTKQPTAAELADPLYVPVNEEEEAAYVDGTHITFRLQLTPTTYREVLVYGLAHYNNVYAGHYHNTTLADSLDPNNHNFIIPLHYGVANKLPLMKRNLLFKDSLRLVFNSYTVTKVKWYQTGIFKIFTYIVAIVIIVWSWGTLSPHVMTALAVLEASVIMFIVTYLLPGLLISMVLKYAFQLIADKIGAELMAIIAVVVAVYAISQGNVGGINYFTGMTTPQMCLQASSAMLSASNAQIKMDIADVSEEMSMFASDSEIKWDALDTAIDLLDTRSTLNPLALLAAPPRKILLDESPSDFYERTIHTGNIGVVALDMVTHYHDVMLRLPKVQYS
jgi:hypothetical protein